MCLEHSCNWWRVAGSAHAFVLTDQGLYACEDNRCGQLGLGHNEIWNQLMRVKDLPGTILQVVASDSHTLVLTDQGLYACGYNQSATVQYLKLKCIMSASDFVKIAFFNQEYFYAAR